MSRIRDELSPLSKMDHVGLIVRNMDEVIKHFKSLGICISELTTDGEVTIAEGIYRDKPYKAKTLIKMFQVGGINLEFLQYVEGESLEKEFLENIGEGLNHLAFEVDDLDREIDKMIKNGFKVIFRLYFEQGGGCVYFDTMKIGGFFVELLQKPPIL